MDGSFPDSPEAVALALLYLILSKLPAEAASNDGVKSYLLRLFAECLATIRQSGAGNPFDDESEFTRH